MKKVILIAFIALIYTLSLSSQKSSIGLGLENNYLIGGVNVSLRGELAMTTKDFIVIKGSGMLFQAHYSLSVGYQRMIYLKEKVPMWVAMNITRDLLPSTSFLLPDVNVTGLEIPVGIQYNFSSGIAPYVELGIGTFLQEVIVSDERTRGDLLRIEVGVKYSYLKE